MPATTAPAVDSLCVRLAINTQNWSVSVIEMFRQLTASYTEGMENAAYFPLRDALRQAAVLVIVTLGFLMSACSSRDEVLRVTSPDGKVDAILFEEDCGAPCSFLYEVRLARKGSRSGERVTLLDAATRNDNAWGVNLRWLDADNLSVEYFRANHTDLQQKTVDIAGDRIRVSLHAGVYDPQAPSGGMLYNLRGRPYN
jgi:hypothetical protein